MSSPDAVLLVSPSCPHCNGMKQALQKLGDLGRIGKLEIIDVSTSPEVAAKLGVRSVPWLRIGELVFEGAHTAGELDKWAGIAAEEDALSRYFREQLGSGNLGLVERFLARRGNRAHALLPLIADPDTEMNVRIGIAAIFETHGHEDGFRNMDMDLIRLCNNEHPLVRADACHLLAQTGSGEALEIIRQLTTDKDPQVREIALDSMETLQGNGRE